MCLCPPPCPIVTHLWSLYGWGLLLVIGSALPLLLEGLLCWSFVWLGPYYLLLTCLHALLLLLLCRDSADFIGVLSVRVDQLAQRFLENVFGSNACTAKLASTMVHCEHGRFCRLLFVPLPQLAEARGHDLDVVGSRNAHEHLRRGR